MFNDGHLYTEVDETRVFDSIEEALRTCCHICGDRLEWTLNVRYNEHHEVPYITGHATSCGECFVLITNIEEDMANQILKYTYWIEIV